MALHAPSVHLITVRLAIAHATPTPTSERDTERGAAQKLCKTGGEAWTQKQQVTGTRAVRFSATFQAVAQLKDAKEADAEGEG